MISIIFLLPYSATSVWRCYLPKEGRPGKIGKIGKGLLRGPGPGPTVADLCQRWGAGQKNSFSWGNLSEESAGFVCRGSQARCD